ncbi:MAG TPA: LysM domain-containing protein [Gemmatimonadaceae bacterium]|nr:LysM domain-containing protein [Gemmatimonadaceae bacterium]
MRRHHAVPAALSQRTLMLALGLALSASPMLAQATKPEPKPAVPPGTVLHVVRRGDTLADIARRFLGDYRRWPELFKANAAQIANANLIFPGQKLYVGADGKPTFNAPVAKAAPADTEATPARTVPLGRPTNGTVNSPLANVSVGTVALRPTVRRGEADAAPFLMPSGGKSNTGTLVSRSDPTVISSATARDQFQLYDDVDVLMPVGVRATVGQKFGVFQYGPELKRGKVRSRVVQPSGVVEVMAVGTGRAARARVTKLYVNMKRGDMLMPLDTTTASQTIRPADVANGPVYEVAYVAGDVVLPTIQSYVVIALPAGARSKVGDTYSLYTDGNALTDGTTDVAPANRVADVSVVRVTNESATAVVVGHDQPAIRAGMKARLVSRMP